jgi:hypothetical protein
MKLLSRWFRREPTEPSWIDPVVLAARIEGEAALLVLDVRGPDAFQNAIRATRRYGNGGSGNVRPALINRARE